MRQRTSSCLRWSLLVLAAVAPQIVYAQVARVMSVQGTAMLERAGQSPRILGTGDGVEQRDVINIANQSNALIEFRDRTRVTLRPNTVFRVTSYSESEPQGMVLGLVKGGMRASTGEIGKRDPASVKFQTSTAIIGVRGTEFDARICEDDCGAEQRAKPAARATDNVAARVIEMSGVVTAVRDRTSRTLVAGAALQPDESIVTPADGYAVLAFRDGSRITLGARSELAIRRFRFDERGPQSGQAHLKLVSGHAHVWTGQLARLGGDAYLFDTAAGTIRPQGTGFSVGGEDVIVVHTWDGTVIVQTLTERVEIRKGDTFGIAVVGGKITVMAAPPPFLLDATVPRPDRVQVDPATFGGSGSDPENGLYVWVRDGAVVLDRDRQTLEVPAGGAALATNTRLAALDTVPNFMRFDTTPLPNLPPRTGFQLPFFKAPDGSTVGLCTP
jgi:hypothetical protein